MPTPANRYARQSLGPWRPQGAPYYLANQANRLGFGERVVEHPRVKDNRQLHRIANLTGEICKNYYVPRQLDRKFTDWQLAAIRETLLRTETEVQKTHLIAAASAEMVDEGYQAFGLEPPPRTYAVQATGEILALRADVVSMRAEIERLTAENLALAERLTAPADPDPEPPHQPNPSRTRRTPAGS